MRLLPRNDVIDWSSIYTRFSKLHSHVFFCFSSDPARVVNMPSVIYVAISLPGFIRCPVDANPPLTLVKWKKDGLPLRVDKVSWCAALVPLSFSLYHVFGWSFMWFHFALAYILSLSLCFSVSYLNGKIELPWVLMGTNNYYWSRIRTKHYFLLHTIHNFAIHSTPVGAKWTMAASVWQRWQRTLSAPIPACLTMPWVPWDGPLLLPWC